MKDALTLCLDQTITLNLYDETINILYQKQIIDSTSGIYAYAFLHVILKKAKRQLNELMSTPPDIDQPTSIGSFGANLERYYLQLITIGVTFEDKTNRDYLYLPYSKNSLRSIDLLIVWTTLLTLIRYQMN
jgi:hypothetical protein